jgi:hypothetical protein
MRAAAALVAAFALAAPAAASAAPAVLDAGDSARTAAQVSRYWTPKRMENAKPVPALRVGPPTPQAGDEGSGDPAPRAGSIAYTSGELADTLSTPNRVHGKVFFTRGGTNWVCSGTAVDAVNLSTVITAGHCVHYHGAWSTNLEFVPGYPAKDGDGDPVYGEWAATGESAPSQWVSLEDFSYDVGAAVVAKDPTSGQALEEVVGARGILFDHPVSGAVRSYGYPATPPFNGSKLRYCDSTLGYRDPFTSAPQTMGIGCDMNGGSSGGGWVVDDGGNGSVISLNSYTRSSTPEVMYGPYFGSTVEALYDSVQGDAPGGVSAPSAGGPTAIPQNLAPLATKKVNCKKAKKRGKKAKKRGKRKRCKVAR